MRPAKTELQSTIELLRATASEIAAPKRISCQTALKKVKVEDVKTKLWCETSLKKRKWEMCKRSFHTRLPSKSESGRCENEAFVRHILQNLKLQSLKMKPELAVPIRGPIRP